MIEQQTATANHHSEWSTDPDEGRRRFAADVAHYASDHGLDPDGNLALLRVMESWEQTATLDDPSTEPCPVWCDHVGAHRWTHELHTPTPYECGRSSRTHEHATVPGVQVLALETDNSFDPDQRFSEPVHVQIDDWKIEDPGEALTFLQAVADACSIAFPGMRASVTVKVDVPDENIERGSALPRQKASDLLTMSDVAGITGFHIQTIYKWSRLGELPTVRIGRSVRVRRAELEKWTVKHARRTR